MSDGMGNRGTRKRMLVTGCGRSGTQYTAILLKLCGLDVPHEKRVGADGICSWLFGVETSSAPWGPPPAGYSFDHTFHLVRDPLACIPSITTFRPAAWTFISNHVPLDASDPLLLRAARYWLHWNEQVEKRAGHRVRIEDMPAAVAGLCERVGAPVDLSKIRQLPTDLNTRRFGTLWNILDTTCCDLGLVRDNRLSSGLLSRMPARYGNVTWDQLRALDPRLTDRIREKAQEYGYDHGSARIADHA